MAMAIEIKNLDINVLQKQVYEHSPKKTDLTPNIRAKVIAMFKKLNNKTKLEFKNTFEKELKKSVIKYELTKTKLQLLIKTNIKIIKFEYLIEPNKLLTNSHQAQPKHIDIFLKTLHKMHEYIVNESVDIKLT